MGGDCLFGTDDSRRIAVRGTRLSEKNLLKKMKIRTGETPIPLFNTCKCVFLMRYSGMILYLHLVRQAFNDERMGKSSEGLVEIRK